MFNERRMDALQSSNTRSRKPRPVARAATNRTSRPDIRHRRSFCVRHDGVHLRPQARQNTLSTEVGRTCAHQNSGDIQISSPLPQKTNTQPHAEKAQVWTFSSPSRLSVNPQPSSAPPTQTQQKPVAGGWLIPSNARAFKSGGRRVTRHLPARPQDLFSTRSSSGRAAQNVELQAVLSFCDTGTRPTARRALLSDTRPGVRGSFFSTREFAATREWAREINAVGSFGFFQHKNIVARPAKQEPPHPPSQE